MGRGLLISSRLEELRRAREWLKPLLEAAIPSRSGRFEMQVAVTEALTNIIEHGYGGDDGYDIRITVAETPKWFEVSLRDRGKSCDPRSIPAPDLSEPREGGYGAHLIRRYVDSIEYECGAKNILRLRKSKAAR